MKQYPVEKIRNIAIAGHGGSGKTSLVEAMLFKSKTTDRMGKVADGNTLSDFDSDEVKRQISLSTSLLPIEWKDHKLNILDTPGLFDFAAGMHEGIRAADSVLINISGKSGVTVGVKKAYKLALDQKKARCIFVSKLDTERADFYKVLEELKAAFGPSVCPVVVPHMDDHKVACYINLLQMKAYEYKDRQAHETALPDTGHRIDGLLSAISEAVAETDEVLFEKYFSGERFTSEEIIKGFHKGVAEGTITPVMCGSATEIEGISALLDILMNLMPSPAEATPEIGIDASGAQVTVNCKADGPAVAYVFKTVADPFVGKLSFIKMVSGSIKPEDLVTNATTGEQTKIGKLLFVRGKKQEDIKELTAGDIAAAAKLDASTGDTLCGKGMIVKLNTAKYPAPCYSMAVKTKTKGDEGKISGAITRLLEEDPTLSYENRTETHQQILSGLGEQHLDVAITKLKNKFGVDVFLEEPIVAYRETIRKKVKVEGKHKKQTGGHGQFGHVWIEFEPCDEEFVFEENVFGGAVPRSFFPAVEKGLRDCIKKGVMAGYPVVGLKATLVDGSYHPVDSSEMSFKMAASIAYREGLSQASPILLEPIGSLQVTVPDESTGDMMGELNKRRGRVLGMNPTSDDPGMTTIDAEIPMSETHDFATLVRQMTHGSGYFTIAFERYEPLPNQLEAEVIEKAKILFSAE